MAQLTSTDLKNFPFDYDSSRDVGDVLIGEDTARPIIEASLSGDDTTLKGLLSQQQYSNAMLEIPHCIYSEDRPKKDPNDTRIVTAMKMSNVERALTAAVESDHAAVVPTLLSFATQHKLDEATVITRPIITKAIKGGHAAIFKALASAYPNAVNFQISHGTMPLYEAVRHRNTDLVAMLLELGADPSPPPSKKNGSYNQSLMSLAAMADEPRMTELLLKYGRPIPGTAALHSAARFGHLNTMRLLMQHGADVNEAMNSNWKTWTPMHFAASRGKIDAMELLEQNGAQSDAKDSDGKTPAQVLEAYSSIQH